MTEWVQTQGRKVVVDYGALWILVIVIGFFSFSSSSFLSYSNLSDILRSISIVSLLAIGVTFSLIIDGLDLSVGSIASLSTIVAAYCLIVLRQELLITLLLPIIFGIVIGCINGLFITKGKLADLLVTLAMMYVVNGIQLTITKGSSIYEGMSINNKVVTGHFIPSFLYIGQGSIMNIPVAVIIMGVCVIGTHIFLEKTTYGRTFFLIGGNKQAAYLSALPVDRYRIYAYMISGFFAALAGIVLASRVGTGQVSAGSPLLMDSITAAYIGIALFGKGKPNVIGTFLGACLMGILLNGFTMLNVPYYSQDIIKGILLIGAILLAKRN
ncbi:ABC transporter permease [Bacillus sp. RG28]|uniref:ABC transporter permease n=1 Tax=Gottfriedia endophytica TaxID=2820819 RepID=A0A940NQK1_9BACI|nr:ABC transporter permease [Gottfriedia endophytica]